MQKLQPNTFCLRSRIVSHIKKLGSRRRDRPCWSRALMSDEDMEASVQRLAHDFTLRDPKDSGEISCEQFTSVLLHHDAQLEQVQILCHQFAGRRQGFVDYRSFVSHMMQLAVNPKSAAGPPPSSCCDGPPFDHFYSAAPTASPPPCSEEREEEEWSPQAVEQPPRRAESQRQAAESPEEFMARAAQHAAVVERVASLERSIRRSVSRESSRRTPSRARDEEEGHTAPTAARNTVPADAAVALPAAARGSAMMVDGSHARKCFPQKDPAKNLQGVGPMLRVPLLEVFKFIDSDDDGFVSPDDVGLVFAQRAVPIGQSEVDVLFEAIASVGSGPSHAVPYASFCTFVSRLRPEVIELVRSAATWPELSNFVSGCGGHGGAPQQPEQPPTRNAADAFQREIPKERSSYAKTHEAKRLRPAVSQEQLQPRRRIGGIASSTTPLKPPALFSASAQHQQPTSALRSMAMGSDKFSAPRSGSGSNGGGPVEYSPSASLRFGVKRAEDSVEDIGAAAETNPNPCRGHGCRFMRPTASSSSCAASSPSGQHRTARKPARTSPTPKKTTYSMRGTPGRVPSARDPPLKVAPPVARQLVANSDGSTATSSRTSSVASAAVRSHSAASSTAVLVPAARVKLPGRGPLRALPTAAEKAEEHPLPPFHESSRGAVDGGDDANETTADDDERRPESSVPRSGPQWLQRTQQRLSSPPETEPPLSGGDDLRDAVLRQAGRRLGGRCSQVLALCTQVDKSKSGRLSAAQLRLVLATIDPAMSSDLVQDVIGLATSRDASGYDYIQLVGDLIVYEASLERDEEGEPAVSRGAGSTVPADAPSTPAPTRRGGAEVPAGADRHAGYVMHDAANRSTALRNQPVNQSPAINTKKQAFSVPLAQLPTPTNLDERIEETKQKVLNILRDEFHALSGGNMKLLLEQFFINDYSQCGYLELPVFTRALLQMFKAGHRPLAQWVLDRSSKIARTPFLPQETPSGSLTPIERTARLAAQKLPRSEWKKELCDYRFLLHQLAID